MAVRQKAAMLGVLAVVGTLIVSPALNRPATPQKSTVVAPKANPVPKTSVPAQRTQPVPRPRPPAAITRPERKAAKKKPRVAGLPSCASVRAQYDSMSLAQRWSAYQSATSEQVAHGRRCLGI
jgi:hypothetical protein